MRTLLATDFAIWPNFANMAYISDTMLSNHDYWHRLATYLLTYDRVVIPTGNFQIIPVLRLMLGEDVFDELIESKVIILAKTSGIVVYAKGHGIDNATFNRVNNKIGVIEAFSCDPEIALSALLANSKPDSLPVRQSKIKNMILDSLVYLDAPGIDFRI